jgi:acid stress-induced BolA-like protein IbaG/YrbA
VALEARLRASPSLSPLAHVRCVDTSGGCGAFFSVLAVSEQFERMPPVRVRSLVANSFFRVLVCCFLPAAARRSPRFSPLPSFLQLRAHRSVTAALGDVTSLHGLTIKTLTPSQWREEQSKEQK